MLVLRHIAFLAVLALAAPLVIAPAHALVDGPWIEEEPARYRMIAAEVDGAPYAALQMELKPGWHTYWRYPGASGLVPEFDFKGCLLYTSPSPRDGLLSRMPSSA